MLRLTKLRLSLPINFRRLEDQKRNLLADSALCAHRYRKAKYASPIFSILRPSLTNPQTKTDSKLLGSRGPRALRSKDGTIPRIRTLSCRSDLATFCQYCRKMHRITVIVCVTGHDDANLRNHFFCMHQGIKYELMILVGPELIRKHKKFLWEMILA